MEEEKKALEARLCSGTLPSDQLTSDSVRIGEVTQKSSAGWNSTRSGSGWQTAFGSSGAVYKRECFIINKLYWGIAHLTGFKTAKCAVRFVTC